MTPEQYCEEIRAINGRLQRLVGSVGSESWRGAGVDEWDRAFAPLLRQHVRLGGLTKEFHRGLRGQFADVDRRNTARMLSDYFRSVRDGSVSEQAFVRGLARLLEQG